MKKKKFGFRLIFKSKFNFLITVAILGFVINFVVQIYRKPSELISYWYSGQASGIEETWNRFGDDFISYSTPYVFPEVLASLAQIESGGRVWASPLGQVKIKTNLDRIYAPASSAIGLMQLTDGHFEQARKYCIVKGELKRGCTMNWIYSRLWPSHSIELAASYLHMSIAKLRKWYRRQFKKTDLIKLSSVIHLCGPEKAAIFVEDQLEFRRFKQCGDHRVDRYVNKVLSFSKKFSQFYANPSNPID